MATKRNSGSPATAPAASPEAAWDAASDLSRQQMTLAAESACAVFRGFESMRKIQEKAAHQALQHYSRAADKLREASGPAQLMQIQAELMRFDLEGATQYWQQLGAVAADMQRELMECCTHLADNSALQRMGSMSDSLPVLASGFNAMFPFNGRAEAS
jgi:class 3 adenylate cyclase